MRNIELNATGLIGYRLHAVDGEAGAVRDLAVDLGDWVVRYMVVGADAWAPGHEILVLPRSLTSVDEARRELEAEMTVEEVRNSPALADGSPITRDFEENWYRHQGWDAYWEAEIDAEDFTQPPPPPAPPASEPLPTETEADGPGLMRLEQIQDWRAETEDGIRLQITDFLLDDADWNLDFAELELDGDHDERCLVQRALFDEADPFEERIFLQARHADLLNAPYRPHPGAEGEAEVRTLTGD